MDSIVQQLTDLGLSVNEAKVYVAMIGRSSFTATEAATEAHIPRQMVYRVLARLMDRGLCVETSSAPRRFSMADPNMGLNSLIELQERNLLAAKLLVPALAEKHAKGLKHRDPRDYVKIIRDPNLIVSVVVDMFANAEHEVLNFVKPPFAGGKRSINKQVDALVSGAHKFNRINRSIYEVKDLSKVYTEGIERSIRDSNEEAHIIETLPIKAGIYDGKKIFMLFPDNDAASTTLTTLLIEHEDLAQALRVTFNLYWEKSMDYWEWKEKVYMKEVKKKAGATR